MAHDMSLTWQLGIVGLSGTLKSFSDVADKLTTVKNSTKDLIETQEKLKKIDKISESYGKATRKWAEATKQLAKLKEEYEKSGKGNAEFSKKVKEAERYVERLNTQKQRQAHLFKAARSELEKEGLKLEGYKKRLKEVNSELARQNQYKKDLNYANSISSYGDQLYQKGSQQIITGLAFGKVALSPIKEYARLEEAQADLKKMIEFKDKAEEQAYFNKIRQVSENSPLQQTEVYEIAGAAAQAGIAKEDIVEFTERAMKLKVAFDMSTEASGEFIAKSKEQLGLSQEQTFAYADTINFLSDNSAAKANQLVEISNRVGGLARTQNISKETNLGFATTLLSMGKSAEVASTGLKQLYLELGKGTDTKKKMEAFKYLGLNPDTINKEMAEDAEGTIIKVLEKIDKLKAEDKAAVLNDLFGEQAIDSVATLANNIDKVKENLALAHSEMTAGSVDKEYANRMNTLKNIFEQTKNTLVNGLADIGEAIGPQLKESLKGWSETFQSLGNFARTHPKLMSGIIKVIGAIAIFNLSMGLTNRFVTGPLTKTFAWLLKFGKHFKFGGLMHALKKMFPLTSKLFSAFTKIGTFLGGKFISVLKLVGTALKLVFTGNPIGLLIVAIVAVIAIFVVLYKKFEWFRNGVKLIFGGFIEYIKGLCKIVVGIFTLNGNMIKEGFHNVANGVKKIFSGVGLIVKNVWKIVKDNLKSVWDWIKTKFKEIWAKIKEYSVMFIPFVGVFILLYKKCEWFRNGVNAVWIAIKNAFSSTWQWIKDKFNSLLEIGSNAWNGLKNSATAIIDKIREAFSGFFDWLSKKWESIKNFGSKLNPFNWFKGDGEVAQNYSGTNYFGGGLTTLAERGAELVEMNNSSFLVNSPVMANLPRGARILNNSQTRKSLSSRVSSLKDRIRNISNNSKTIIGGDTITINITGNSSNKADIAREVKKVMLEIQNKKRRTAIV
jgi:phage tail tape measure protein, TP901 family